MSTKKKVLHIIISLQRGGCEMALLRMLPHLDTHFQHSFLTLKEKGPLAPLFEEKNIPVFSVHQKSLLDLPSYWRLVKHIRKEKPDLIFTYLLHADMIGRFFLQFFTPAPLVSSLVTTYNFQRYWFARLFERISHFLAQGYMANAEVVKNTYVHKFHVPAKKITVVPCGIDIEKFSQQTPDPQLKEELGITSHDHVFICVANLHKNKGHHLLVEAFERLQNPQTKLLLVGEGVEKENLLEQVKNYTSRENILFLGRRQDVPALLKLSSTFVLPTFFEGMSNAILEAMANKMLILTTSIPENQELIQDTKNGLLFEAGDQEALYQALLKSLTLSEAERTRLAEQAFTDITARHSMPRMVRVWDEYFLELTKGNE